MDLISFVFYLSWKPGKDRQEIALPNGRKGYIRVELHPGSDQDALDKANPLEDETVMNSHS